MNSERRKVGNENFVPDEHCYISFHNLYSFKED